MTTSDLNTDVANRFSALQSLEIPTVEDTWIKIWDSIKRESKGFRNT
jgi:hypothetical protein